MPGSDFSVIIPWHKNKGLLERAVRSVLRQSSPPLKTIIVCNGDGAQHYDEICEAFHGIHFEILKSLDPNANTARNAGIEACQTKYCSFLDCDDEYTSDRIESAGNFFEHYGEQIYSARGIRARSSGKSWNFPRRKIEQGEDVADYILAGGNLLMTTSLSMPTTIARKIMFDPDVRKFQDFDFLIRARSRGVNIFVDMKSGYIYHDEDVDQRLSTGRNYESYIRWVQEHPSLNDRSKAAFLSRFIAQHEFPRNFNLNLSRIIRGSTKGGIPVSETALMLLKNAIPPKIRNEIYELYFKFRQGEN